MDYSVVNINDEVRRIGDFLILFNQKEKELLELGEVNLKQVSSQMGQLGAKVATSSSGNLTAGIIIAAVGKGIEVAGNWYIKKEHKKLEAKIKEFAENNADKIEELGQMLRENIFRVRAIIDSYSNQARLSLNENSFQNYSSYLKANIKLQEQLFAMSFRFYIFKDYYKYVKGLAGRLPNEELLSPILPDEWFDKRVEKAQRITQNSSSLLYDYSLDGHLLLCLPLSIYPELPVVENYRVRAITLLNNEFQKPHITERFNYIAKVKDLLGNSALETDINKKYSKTKRRYSLYQKRYWILFGVLSIIAIIVLIIVVFVSIIISIFQSLFG